jgi:hypothetical protein
LSKDNPFRVLVNGRILAEEAAASHGRSALKSTKENNR